MILAKHKTLTCPKCGSIHIEALGTKKKFSGKKAIIGAIATAPIAGVTAPVGALAGFLGKKGKTQFHCLDCGTMFEKKI